MARPASVRALYFWAWMVLLGASRPRTRPLSGAPAQRHRKGLDQRFAAARQTRIGHEIIVRVERLLPARGRDSLARAVRQYAKALLIIHQVGLHNLVEHVFVNGRIEQRNERLDAS